MKDPNLKQPGRIEHNLISNPGRQEMEQYTLVFLFLIQQRWNYYIGKKLADDKITTKQWLMMIIIENAFNHDPSMQDVADAMSTTHQNVKQLAVRLETRGFLKIERDPENRRILRLKTTDESRKYWEERSPEDLKSIAAIFNGMNDDEMRSLFEVMIKLENLSGNLYEEAKRL
jgi:DNA-binding MarR family transcriptional regulator